MSKQRSHGDVPTEHVVLLQYVMLPNGKALFTEEGPTKALLFIDSGEWLEHLSVVERALAEHSGVKPYTGYMRMLRLSFNDIELIP